MFSIFQKKKTNNLLTNAEIRSFLRWIRIWYPFCLKPSKNTYFWKYVWHFTYIVLYLFNCWGRRHEALAIIFVIRNKKQVCNYCQDSVCSCRSGCDADDRHQCGNSECRCDSDAYWSSRAFETVASDPSCGSRTRFRSRRTAAPLCEGAH